MMKKSSHRGRVKKSKEHHLFPFRQKLPRQEQVKLSFIWFGMILAVLLGVFFVLGTSWLGLSRTDTITGLFVLGSDDGDSNGRGLDDDSSKLSALVDEGSIVRENTLFFEGVAKSKDILLMLWSNLSSNPYTLWPSLIGIVIIALVLINKKR